LDEVEGDFKGNPHATGRLGQPTWHLKV